MPEDAPDSRQTPCESRTLGQKMAYASELALTLPASVCAGWLLGRLLEGWLGAHGLQLTGIVVGAVAGMARLAQTALRADREDEAAKPSAAPPADESRSAPRKPRDLQ